MKLSEDDVRRAARRIHGGATPSELFADGYSGELVDAAEWAICGAGWMGTPHGPPMPPVSDNGESGGSGGSDEEQTERFAVVTMSEVKAKATEWVVPGLLPASDVAVLVGDEGLGKGLWWIAQIQRVTDRGGHVLLIAAEDDPERALRPRLDAAGVDAARVHLIVADRETLTGHPYLPTHAAEVAEMIERYSIRLLILDPWVSVVPGNLNIKDTQQARQALDPLTRLARQTGVCILAVAHTNRTNGSTRDRVGLTAVLRQVARVVILALEDPEDDEALLVGVDKANNTPRGPAIRYRKSGLGDAWKATIEEVTDMTIRDWDDKFRLAADGRTTDRWLAVQAVAQANKGPITRAEIIACYGGDEHKEVADKAIGRWVKSKRLVRIESGLFEVSS